MKIDVTGEFVRAFGGSAQTLTLTDAERQAIREAIDAYALNNDDPDCERIERALRGLLDRISHISTGDYPDADNAPKQDTTPTQGSVPPGWMAKPFYVDPPAGHRYGFPKLYDRAFDGDMTEWMIRNGYPEHLARKNLPCTFTASE